jgi:hypothetical protein
MFEIRFQGLITHATVNDQSGHAVQRAVLYVVPSMTHIALLTINVNDWKSGDPEDYATGDARCYKLDGTTNVTSGLSPGVPSKHLQGVVSLNDPNITTGVILKPRKEIGMLTPIANLFHLIEVPDGTLAVHNWFSDQALFNSIIYPMAQTVVFTAKASSDVTFTIVDYGGRSRTVTIQPNAVVYISNFPIDNSVPMPHFEVEASFFDQTANQVTVNNPVVIKTPSFPLGSYDDQHDTCAIAHQLSIECSDSQFP